MKRILSLFLTLLLIVTSAASFAEAGSTPPASADGGAPAGDPPADGQAPAGDPQANGQAPAGDPASMPDGQTPGGNPPSMPDGEMPGGMPPGGGQSAQPEQYDAVLNLSEDTTHSDDAIASTGVDENAVLVTNGDVTLENMEISRVSQESTGGDTSSFYGVGAAVLTTGGTVRVNGSTITTDAAGGAGVFAYGDGVAYVSDTTITTAQNTSGGIHVAGGGTLYASNLTVETQGESAAAIRSDRGSGTMVIDGGTYVSNGVGSPAVYVTADISIHDADLIAAGSEALCLEGLNTVRLYDCNLTGNMDDLSQNDNTWTVILYQSMSGDSQIGEGRMEMVGGTLTSQNGGLFYTTNTESEFVISGVAIDASEDCEYFLRCTGNANERGWGASGQNGADCTFTAIAQDMPGDILWDSISTLNLYVTEGSTLTGAIIDDESCAGEGGDGTCSLYLDAASAWVVTGDSVLTAIAGEGAITDVDGHTVTIAGQDGTVFVQGDSPYTVTVLEYSDHYDGTGAGSASAWSEHIGALDA